MELKNINIIIIILLILLLISLSLSNRTKNKYRDRYNNQVELYNSITDSLKKYKNKDSLNTAVIKVMETDKTKDFLKIKNLEGYNLKLQEFVKSQEKEIKNLKVALIVATETSYTDTLKEYYPVGGDTIVFSKSILLDSINNKWINAMWGFKMGKSILQVKTFDEFTISIKNSKNIPYAEITNLNPYSTTKDMRVYQVAVPKQKKNSFGYSIGFGGHYGISSKIFDYGPYIGISFNGNIVR